MQRERESETEKEKEKKRDRGTGGDREGELNDLPFSHQPHD